MQAEMYPSLQKQAKAVPESYGLNEIRNRNVSVHSNAFV